MLYEDDDDEEEEDFPSPLIKLLSCCGSECTVESRLKKNYIKGLIFFFFCSPKIVLEDGGSNQNIAAGIEPSTAARAGALNANCRL